MDMEFAIQVDDNGDPVGHPMSMENLRYIHEDISLDNLPPGMEPFVHVSAPQLGPYQVLASEESTYARVGGVLQRVFEIRDMTEEEKNDKIERALAIRHPDDWVFNYEKCAWRPLLNQSGSTPNVIG